MLACARLGAPHTVVFGGFSADALSAAASRTATAAGSWSPPTAATDGARPARSSRQRRRRPSPSCPGVAQRARRTTDRAGGGLGRHQGRLVARSSSTASPTSTPRSRTTPSTRCTSCTRPARRLSPRASCTPRAATSRTSRTRTLNVFDLKAETDVYWCAADIGWVTGHSYIVYGPLANGATSVMYEGTPTPTPAGGRSSTSTR